ncbi:hypothetical protein [Halomicronema sp. CCY15110]|uniref:hypothetical protein n=1 Tax=Halomicronema sp. CCY15110 TaxID=2767773 RepID=UPI0019515F94|nr:hypothetical protein [Halomicronema sp. CCY15110]
MSFGVGSAAKASNDVALSFELSPSPQAVAAAKAEAAAVEAEAAEAAAAATAAKTLVNAEAPLPIPAGAENPPMASDNSRPSGVYGGLEAVALGSTASVQALLPAPPPIPAYVQALQTAIAPPPEPVPEPEAKAQQLTETEIQAQIALFIGIQEKTFEAPQETVAVAPEPDQPPAAQPTVFQYSFDNFHTLFTGGTESLVARAVGSAEGTRTPEGHKNPAYYGHVDPGNGVWNLGTFSYQHGAASPEEADDKQLRRLQTQTETLREKALAQGLQLTKEELLNGIDLANQAPLAALDRGGYIDWLKEAHSLGMQGSEAIIWARTRSFIDPDTQRWNAPGLGNNIYSISHDQERRATAIARAISAFNAQTQVAIAPAPVPNNDDITLNLEPEVAPPERLIDPVPFAFDAFPGRDSASDTVAQTPAPEDDVSPPVSALSDDAESAVIAMAAPNGDKVSVTPSKSPTRADQGIEPQPQSRRLGRLGQAVTNFLTGNAPEPAPAPENPPAATEGVETTVTPPPATESVSLSEMTEPSAAPVSEPIPEPEAAKITGAIAAPPTEENPAPVAESSAPASAGGRTAVTDSPTPAAIALPPAADRIPASAAPAPADPTPDSATAVPEPAPIRFDPPTSLPMPVSEATFNTSEPPSATRVTPLAAPKTATAPADETDAETIKQRTLASLDQLQSILRAEAEAEAAANQP